MAHDIMTQLGLYFQHTTAVAQPIVLAHFARALAAHDLQEPVVNIATTTLKDLLWPTDPDAQDAGTTPDQDGGTPLGTSVTALLRMIPGLTSAEVETVTQIIETLASGTAIPDGPALHDALTQQTAFQADQITTITALCTPILIQHTQPEDAVLSAALALQISTVASLMAENAVLMSTAADSTDAAAGTTKSQPDTNKPGTPDDPEDPKDETTEDDDKDDDENDEEAEPTPALTDDTTPPQDDPVDTDPAPLAASSLSGDPSESDTAKKPADDEADDDADPTEDPDDEEDEEDELKNTSSTRPAGLDATLDPSLLVGMALADPRRLTQFAHDLATIKMESPQAQVLTLSAWTDQIEARLADLPVTQIVEFGKAKAFQVSDLIDLVTELIAQDGGTTLVPAAQTRLADELTLLLEETTAAAAASGYAYLAGKARPLQRDEAWRNLTPIRRLAFLSRAPRFQFRDQVDLACREDVQGLPYRIYHQLGWDQDETRTAEAKDATLRQVITTIQTVFTTARAQGQGITQPDFLAQVKAALSPPDLPDQDRILHEVTAFFTD